MSSLTVDLRFVGPTEFRKGCVGGAWECGGRDLRQLKEKKEGGRSSGSAEALRSYLFKQKQSESPEATV